MNNVALHRFGIIVFALVLITNSLLSSFAVPVQIQAGSNVNNNVFTDVTLTDANGKEIDADKYPERQVSKNSIINVKLNWNLTDKEVSDHDFFTIPKELNIEKNRMVR
ncbi:hypothetical protein ACLIBH_14175 [Virgibacillus sp. W0430]|uniref:hypothetical protein n=1 Tax=Virgibacillus sp. W0430 TaxID=3391580 RepID=UPI003F48EBE5